MSEKLSKFGKKTGMGQTVTLANGTECQSEEIEIDIETKYFTGKVKALIMDNPFADIVMGNIGHIPLENKGTTINAVETRASKCNRIENEKLQEELKNKTINDMKSKKVSETTFINSSKAFF